jgi:hypothetical protein
MVQILKKSTIRLNLLSFYLICKRKRTAFAYIKITQILLKVTNIVDVKSHYTSCHLKILIKTQDIIVLAIFS